MLPDMWRNNAERLRVCLVGSIQASLLDLFCSYMEDVTVHYPKILDTD